MGKDTDLCTQIAKKNQTNPKIVFCLFVFLFGAVGPKVAEGHQLSAGAGKVAPVRARPFLVLDMRRCEIRQRLQSIFLKILFRPL